MNEKEIEEWKQKIDNMSHTQMASMWRFTKAGHPVFDSTLPLFDYFKKRFDKFGGMTSKVSKLIGWS